jgi:hypothetical protein
MRHDCEREHHVHWTPKTPSLSQTDGLIRSAFMYKTIDHIGYNPEQALMNKDVKMSLIILEWIHDSSTYGHSQLKTGHPVRSAIHKQLNGRLVLRWVTTWESLLLYVLSCFVLFCFAPLLLSWPLTDRPKSFFNAL